MRRNAFVQRSLCLLALFAAIAAAGAQDARIILDSGLSAEQTHAWAVYRNSAEDLILAHLPPRDVSRVGTVEIAGSQAGQMQSIRQLGRKMPVGIASIDTRVFLVFPKIYTNARRIMRVYSARAVPSPVGAMWSLAPVERLNTEPPIITEGTLIGLTATSDALWALLDEDEGVRLLTLQGNRWSPVPLPEDLQGPPPRWRLVAIDDAPVLVSAHDDQLIARVWNGSMRTWSAGGLSPVDEPDGDYRVLSSRRGLKLVQWNANARVSIDSWTPAGLFRLIGGLEIPAHAVFTHLESVNRLVALARQPEPADQQEQPGEDEPARGADPDMPAGLMAWEVDLSDGTVLHRGPPGVQTPVSVNEFRFLVSMMILIMLGVLVVVIMPDRHDSMRIPEGFALADPGRRLLATMIDVGLLVVLMSELFDVDPSEIFTLGVLIRPGNAWLVIPATMLAGVLVMSFFEWLMGATPGKLLIGVRVVRAESGAMQRPLLWSALVRNTIKWTLPPVTALALVDPEMLHRGDRASRSVVAYPLPEGPVVEDETDSEDSPGP